MKWRLRLLIVLGIVALLVAYLGGLSGMSKRPEHLGVKDGRLAGCPDSPNCVSSEATDAEHRMQPIPFQGTVEQALERLKAVLDEMPRTTVIEERENYLHAECVSRLFGFVDDVEFLIDEKEQLIHFRSASRTGYSDLGVNRKRMVRLRELFLKS